MKEAMLMSSVGLGVSALAITALTAQFVPSISIKSPRIIRYLSSRKQYIGYKLQKKRRESVRPDEKIQILAGLIIGILFLGIGRGLAETVLLFSLGGVTGIGGTYVLQTIYNNTVNDRCLKEVAVLFESLEMLIKAGYTPFQALRASALLVPGLEKNIMRCVSRWPSGYKQALRQMRNELGIPEAGILVSMLTQAETAGKDSLNGILGKEARNIEQVRRMRQEVKISNRPLYIMLYAFLPFMTTIALVLGPFLYKFSRVLSTVKGGF